MKRIVISKYDLNTLGALEGLRLQVDQALGYPKAPTSQSTDPYAGWTMTCSATVYDPATGGAWLPVTDEMAEAVATVLSVARGKVINNIATQVDALVAALPDPVDASIELGICTFPLH